MIKNTVFSLGRAIVKLAPVGWGAVLKKFWFTGCRVGWIVRNHLCQSSSLQISTPKSPKTQMHPEGHIAMMLWCSYFEQSEREFIAALLSPGMTVINVGANSGLYTVLAGAIVGETGRVHAFEPSSDSFRRLTKNIALNRLCNVTATSQALSNSVRTLYLNRDPDNPSLDSHYFISEEEGGEGVIEKIPCDTLDNYWLNRASPKSKFADVAIVDVEGAEYDVLVGAKSLIESSTDIVLMIECTKMINEIESFLRIKGFRIYAWDSKDQSLKETNLKRGNIIAGRPHSSHIIRMIR